MNQLIPYRAIGSCPALVAAARRDEMSLDEVERISI